jgi:prepilin-type N-terminal cleavage/methylation domain-containing protein
MQRGSRSFSRSRSRQTLENSPDAQILANSATTERCVPPLACRQRDRQHCLQASSGTRRSGRRPVRKAFSLLEVILALAILAGSMAALGEAVRLGLENARVARDLTDAQLFCESKMAELEAGFLTTDSVTDMPIEPMAESTLESSSESLDTEWLYSVEAQLIDDEALMLVTISVQQDPTTVAKPVTFTMTRMFLDESLLMDETTEDTL